MRLRDNSYRAFAQKVRRYRRDDLLRGIARLNVLLEHQLAGRPSARFRSHVTNFYLGGVARVEFDLPDSGGELADTAVQRFFSSIAASLPTD